MRENERRKAQLEDQDRSFDEYLKYGLSLLDNLSGYYENAEVEVKQKIVGSIFPEKLVYINKNYRTTKVNEVLALLTTNIRDSKKKEIKKGLPNNDKPHQAPPIVKISNQLIEDFKTLYLLKPIVEVDTSILSRRRI